MEKDVTKQECGLLKNLYDANKYFIILDSITGKRSLADRNKKNNINYQCKYPWKKLFCLPYYLKGPARSLVQHELPTGSQPPSGILLLHHGLPWAAGEQPDLPWSFPRAAGESLLWHLEHLLRRLLHWPWCSQSADLSPVAKLRYAALGFFFFLNVLSQRCYHCCWLIQPWPLLGPSWSRLALTLLDIKEASRSFLQKPLL